MTRPALRLDSGGLPKAAPRKPPRPAESPERLARRKTAASVVTASVVVHLLLAGAAGVWIVAKIFPPTPARFEVHKPLTIPAQEREHRMNMAEFDALTPKPSFTEKLASLRPTEFALPDLPRLPMDQMLPLDPSALISDQVSSLVGDAGLGAGGAGLGGGGKGFGTEFSFMGIRSSGRNILLLFDVSESVVNEAAKTDMPLVRIKEETVELIGKLPITARFGLIQFTQNYKAFSAQLLPATDANRASALQWIENEWTESGRLQGTTNPLGLLAVLELAASMEPDVIFLISDGSFQYRPEGSIIDIPWEDVDDAVDAIQGARLNFIGFAMEAEDEGRMRRIVSGSGGRFREIR